jgi:Uma2 family endonuclease
METIEKTTLTPRQLQTLENGGVVETEASWEEFLEFAETCRFKADYHKGKIIVMGLAAFIHETLLMRTGMWLGGLYQPPEHFVSGSNTGIALPETDSYYNADVVVTKGLPEFKDNSIAIITNPYLLVEVLSKSTYNYDLNEKLLQYEKLESLQAILFIDRFEKAAFTFQRTDNPKVWIQTIFDKTNPEVVFDKLTFSIDNLFDNLPETK